jgi:uncharacterized membrane protein YdjX (TVP38/TMEM64 family)
MTWRRVVAIGGLVAVVAIATVLVMNLGGVADVRATVGEAGLWAPLLFLLVHCVVTVAPFPRTILTVASGVLFGSFLGLLLAMVATIVSAGIAFLLVRDAGADVVARRAPQRAVEWVRARLDRRGLLAMISLRLIPAVPFSVMNYASGLSGVRLWAFLLGTFIGVLPGTLTVVVLGDAAVGGNPPPALLAVSVAGALVGVVGAVIAARQPKPFDEPVGIVG